jgi:hypothetical protein
MVYDMRALWIRLRARGLALGVLESGDEYLSRAELRATVF